MAEWLEPKAVDVTPELLSSAGGHSFVAGLLAQRGITDPQEACAFLDPDCYTPIAAPHPEQARPRFASSEAERASGNQHKPEDSPD